MDEFRLGSRTLQPHRQLLAEGQHVHLGKRALDILSVLAEANGEIVTKDELLAAVWPGVIVEENALVEALRDGTIHGAGIDVFDQEPLPFDHPLRELRRAVLTPHLGYVAADNYRRFFGEAVEDIAAFLAGAPVRVLE